MSNYTSAQLPDRSPLVPVSLASTAVQTVLYGIFFCLFCLSTFLLVQRQSASQDRRIFSSFWFKPPFLAGIILFAALTVHESTYIWRLFGAFLGSEGSWYYYGDVSQTSFYVQTATSLVVSIISDAMLVYRLWIVWNFSWKVTLLPATILLAGVGLCVANMWQLLSYVVSEPGDFPDRTALVAAVFTDTVVTNFYCSGMIAYKLVVLSRSSLRCTSSQRGVLWYLAILIESAALYVGITLLFIVVWATGAEVNSLFECAIPFVAGIAFMFINLRVALGYTPQTTYYQMSSLVLNVFTGSDESAGLASTGTTSSASGAGDAPQH